jgi:cephalosporin hydroxylase
MSAVRTRIARSRPIAAVRTTLAIGSAPLLRYLVAEASHEKRLESARWLIPGSHGQKSDEITAFAEIATERRPVTVCEIGTLMGGTSLFLAGIAPTIRLFVGIDIEIHNERLVSSLTPRRVIVHHIEGSSHDVNVLRRTAEVLDGRSLDILFIDGDHSYQGVRDDYLLYRDLVSTGGLIAFHDIVEDNGGAFWSGGVPKFWSEIKRSLRHWEFVHDWEQGGFGIGVLEHDPSIEVSL